MTRTRGFTLLEMIVAVAIIGLLAAVVVPMVFGTLSQAKITRTASDVKTVVTAMRRYYQDVGAFPVAGAAGADPGLVKNVSGVASWRGPYLERWPSGNAWGAAATWTYERSAAGGAYTGTDFNLDGVPANESRLSVCGWSPTDATTLTNIDRAYDDGIITAPAGGATSSSGAMYWDAAAGCLRVYVGEGAAQ